MRYLTLLLLLLLTACAIESGDPPQVNFDDLMNQGREALAAGEGQQAHELFARALHEKPQDAEASLGLALADVQELFRFLDEVVAFALEYSSQSFASSTEEDGLSPDDNLNDTVHHFLKQIFEPVVEEMLISLADAGADPALLLELEGYPLSFAGNELANLRGQWDAADAIWLDGTVNLVQGGIDYLQGVNLDMDLGLLLDTRAVGDLLAGQPLNIFAAVPELLQALQAILEDPEKPDFLLPLPDEQWRFESSQLHLAIAVRELIDVWGVVDAESDNQFDDVLGYHDLDGDDRREENEPYFICGVDEFPPELMQAMPALLAIGEELFAALAEGTELDIDPNTVQLFDLAAINMLLEAFNLPSLIPETPVHLAELFTDPPGEELKESLIALLSCVNDHEDVADQLTCLIDLL